MPPHHHGITARWLWANKPGPADICTVGQVVDATRIRFAVAFGAQPARVLAAAGAADGKPVRRRPVPGRAGRRPAVQSGAGRRPVGDRRRVRRAVPAVLAAGPVRRCAAGPLGPARGADRGQPRAAAAGDRGRRAAGGRRRRSGRAVRRADRQRLHPVRHLRPVGGAAARGAARAGGHDELGGHRHRRHRHVPRRELHAAAALAVRRRRRRRGHDHLPGRRSRSPSRWCCRCAFPGTCWVPTTPRGRSTARRSTRWPPGGCYGARTVLAHADRGGHAVRAWPPTGWCSASTRCWCW